VVHHVLHLFTLPLDQQDSPKKQEGAVCLHKHANDRPANQHQENATKEECGTFQSVRLEEEPERLLKPNDQDYAGQKKYLIQHRKYRCTRQTILNEHYKLKVKLVINDCITLLCLPYGGIGKRSSCI